MLPPGAVWQASIEDWVLGRQVLSENPRDSLDRCLQAIIRIWNGQRNVLHYAIVFKDNGIGFDEQYAKQIFVIFQRLNTAAEFSGSGIGLALCKKIISNHQGEIYAESTEGEGSSFHIILPARQPRR